MVDGRDCKKNNYFQPTYFARYASCDSLNTDIIPAKPNNVNEL
ncbi:MAG: hypothetical protein AWT59_2767 [Candidatus Gallionella acididurans]|uniref:Uncharacterized protein n=1 Tax=Candidatus Gallionella acididurans TaxID=1796491 RepID=A0A139BQ45_9PROT|nr:MAG: hypothetical protein AWT59_2767 [Candidatus Gallionella acididurans]